MRSRLLAVPRHVSPGVAWVVVVSGLALLFSATTVAAQLRTDGTIIGQVTDESDAVLPGVTVTATSPALQVASVTAVTDNNGEYRLTPLPIGLYTVEYALPSFRTLRRDAIRLTVGFTARVDVVLALGGLEQTVTVTGQSPLIDTTVAATTTQVTRENMEIIPTGRNGYIGLMQFTPGTRPPLDVGGSSNNQNPAFRAFGQSDQAWQSIDGVMTSNPRIGDSGNYFDFGSNQVQLRVNVYNLLNTQVATSIQNLSGPDFGLVLTRVLPRIMNFEVQYRF